MSSQARMPSGYRGPYHPVVHQQRRLTASGSLPGAWIISAGALGRLERAGLAPGLLRELFDRRSTLFLAARPASIVALASTTAVFRSETALARALVSRAVPASAPDVLVDLEHWPFTPLSEQLHPIAALRAAAAVAAAYGKHLVFAPAFDLMKVLGRGDLSGEMLWEAFDRRVLEPAATIVSDIEVQAQGAEGTALAQVVAARAIAEIHRVRPAVRVFVGLSTNPDGRSVTPADLVAVVRATPDAAGYWLNVPEAGAACPACGNAASPVGVAFLEQLAAGAATPSRVP